MKPSLLLLAALVPGTSATPASAQDVVVMRRSVAPARIEEAPSREGRWKVGAPVAVPGCSANQPTTAPVTCVAPDGKAVPDSRCSGDGAKPDGKGTGPDYSTCSYKWITGVYGAPTPACSTQATRTRSVSCQRQDATLTPVAETFCDPSSPDAKATEYPVTYYGGCTYVAGGWTQGPPSSTCSTTATRPETATTCTRSGGSVPSAATIQDCRDAGVPVTRTSAPYNETSGCPPTPTPTSGKCETAAGNRWTGKFINGNTQYRTHTKSIASYSEFQSACEDLHRQYGIGACFLSASSTGGKNPQFIYPANALYYEQYSWITFANRSDLIAANCGQ